MNPSDMNPYEVRVEAERLIGEDRVPTDVLVELIEDFGDDPLASVDRDRDIVVTAGTLVDLIHEADRALDGDSNDAEHDALYSLRESLSGLIEGT